MPTPNEGLDLFGQTPRTRYRLLACEIFYREYCLATALARPIIDLEFLSQGLHDLKSEAMCARLQQAVDEQPAGRYQAVLLGFALCNNGIVGLTARDVPIVVPRGHDCITMFLGSREAYADYFVRNSGTYFMTTGWVERDKENLENTREDEANVMRGLGLDKTFEQYAAIYGEEQARMIVETLGGLNHYSKLCHVDMGVAPHVDDELAEQGRAEAERRGWAFERVKGRMDLIMDLANGNWDEERFLIVEPGHRIEPTHDEVIMRAVPV